MYFVGVIDMIDLELLFSLYEKNISIENTVWDLSHKPSFEYNNTDTTSRVNLKVNVRHSSSYPFSNLWLFSYSKSFSTK